MLNPKPQSPRNPIPERTNAKVQDFVRDHGRGLQSGACVGEGLILAIAADDQ